MDWVFQSLHWYDLEHLQEELSPTGEHRHPEEDGVAEVGAQTDHDHPSTDPGWVIQDAGMLVGQQEVRYGADSANGDVSEGEPINRSVACWWSDCIGHLLQQVWYENPPHPEAEPCAHEDGDRVPTHPSIVGD